MSSRTKYTCIAVLLLLAGACQPSDEQASVDISPKPGIWRATLDLGGGDHLPFNFSFTTAAGAPLMAIYNGEDTIAVTEIVMKKDSLIVHLPVYDAVLKARVQDTVMRGQFINYYRGPNYTIPFEAKWGVSYRFRPAGSPAAGSIDGRWEAWFGTDTTDLDQAIGLFQQQGDKVTGTFLSPYGDYRFLAGQVTGDSLFLSNFDGMHVMYFEASLGDTIRGLYRSGDHFSEPWIAWRNDTLALPNAFRMASAREPFTVYLPDSILNMSPRKPAIIQIMGTWCPNCKDEARLLDQLYRDHKGALQVVGLSFERTRNREQALTNIERTRQYLDLSYPVVYAGYADAEGVSEVLPNLEGFTAYPTTIFLHGNGKVAAVHTGFSGPATGAAYKATVAAYKNLVEEMLQHVPD